MIKKNILTFLIIFITITLNAQVKFISNDKEDMRRLSDSIAINSKRNYIFYKEIPINKYNYTISYMNATDNNDKLDVKIHIHYVGANADLEIEGTPQYKFERVDGKYLDLFPFWNKFIDKVEDPEALVKKGHTYITKDDEVLLFSRNSTGWYILMRDVIK